MTDTPKTPRAPHKTLRARIMTELRRAPDGLDPDDVYALVVRLQARIDFLEGQSRQMSNAALLDVALKQAAEIRRQALDAAERAWTEIVQDACEEAARRREEARRDVGRLLDDTCTEIRALHDRLQVSSSAPIAAPHATLHGPDRNTHREDAHGQHRPGPANTAQRSSPMRRDSLAEPSLGGTAEPEPSFRLPSWLEP